MDEISKQNNKMLEMNTEWQRINWHKPDQQLTNDVTVDRQQINPLLQKQMNLDIRKLELEIRI